MSLSESLTFSSNAAVWIKVVFVREKCKRLNRFFIRYLVIVEECSTSVTGSSIITDVAVVCLIHLFEMGTYVCNWLLHLILGSTKVLHRDLLTPPSVTCTTLALAPRCVLHL